MVSGIISSLLTEIAIQAENKKHQSAITSDQRQFSDFRHDTACQAIRDRLTKTLIRRIRRGP